MSLHSFVWAGKLFHVFVQGKKEFSDLGSFFEREDLVYTLTYVQGEMKHITSVCSDVVMKTIFIWCSSWKQECSQKSELFK